MLRKSRKDKVVDQATSTTAQVKDAVVDKVVPAVTHAAEQTREWAGPRVHAAKEWAAPRAQKGIDAAAPRVEQAVDAVSPKIDAARDKLVDEVLPKLVDAITAATSQASAVREEATARGSDAVAVLKGEAVAKPKKKHRVRKFLLFSGVVAAGVAAVKAMRGKKEDPWATPSGADSWSAPSVPAAPSPETSTDTSTHIRMGTGMGTGAKAGDAAAAAADAALQEAAASEATGTSDDVTESAPEGGATSKSTSGRARKSAAKSTEAAAPAEPAEPADSNELGGEG
jgi:hypothetical protein